MNPAVPTLPPLDELIRIAEFRVALREFQRTGERVARSCGLTPRWYLLLLLVEGAPDRNRTATVGDLCDRLHLAQSTVTELVDRIVGAGLLERRVADHDARVTHVRATRKGRRRLARACELIAAERAHLRQAVQALGEMTPS
jgi:DNA-binding MarR family transcriptional regulator